MAVADINVAGGVHSDSQRYVELAGSLAEFAPLDQELAFGGELLDAVVVTVGNINIAIFVERHSRWEVKLAIAAAFFSPFG